ncbi:hypothetical protein INR49_021245 [Caranx melampygus]|nr:hypothetical protein INR49_021245 [Caranx melampygus]
MEALSIRLQLRRSSVSVAGAVNLALLLLTCVGGRSSTVQLCAGVKPTGRCRVWTVTVLV